MKKEPIAYSKENILAYSYIRFSHPDQAKGDSLRRQTEQRDAWLARNNVTLDTKLTLEDKGISGFTGEHRDNPDRHALAAFLYAVEHGSVTKGSYLIVESLDRLSREDILPAMTLMLNIINSGIRIVQLLPVEMVYDKNANPMHLMMMIMELSRGHSESAMKSERVGGAWREKRRRAAENGEPLTARVPAWLRLVDGEWEVDERAAETVRRINRLAITGHGLGQITKKFNKEGVPVIGHADHWARSSVAKLLNNRAAIGEYQPFTGRGKKRKPDGKPIPDYYPAILTEQEWFAARAASVKRKGKVGRLPKGNVNIFAGLLYDARDGGTLRLMGKGKKNSGRLLVPGNAVNGVEGSVMVSFPFRTFEPAILSCLREIDLADIMPKKEGETDKTLALAGQLGELEMEIEKIKQRLQTRYSDAVADVLERHEENRRQLANQLDEAMREKSSPLSDSWNQCRGLVDAVDADETGDVRVRLRSVLRRILESVWCLFVGRGSRRLAAVQLWFTGGSTRSYLILHQPARGNAASKTPAGKWAGSFDAAGLPGDLDLRNRDHAKKLAEALATIDLASLRVQG